MTILLWSSFILLIIFLVLLDLGIVHKKKEIRFGEALSWSLFWILLALLFNIAVYYIYEYGDFPAGPFFQPKPGSEAALQFFTGYLLEKSLSLDNIFVISLIFISFKIPLKLQHRVLVWGILTAAILRALLILFGVALVNSFAWILYVFGIFLLFSGIKLLCEKSDDNVKRKNMITKIAELFCPVTDSLQHDRFFIKEDGVWKLTPLFLAFLQIEFSDLIFAVDSIPAIFSITLDPFIVYTSNIFAIFGLRALYFTLAPLLSHFRYLKASLALILVYIGIKMVIIHYVKIPVWVSLVVIVTILCGGILLSVLFPKGAHFALKLPFDSDSFFTFTLKQARRIVIFIVGMTVLLVGIVLIFLPGPALLVIPLGIAILSTEFLWARRFLKKIKNAIGRKEE